MESKSRVSPSSRYTASVVAYVSNPRMAAKSIPKRVSVPTAKRLLWIYHSSATHGARPDTKNIAQIIVDPMLDKDNPPQIGTTTTL